MNTSTVVIGLVLIVMGVLTVWLFCLGGLLILIGLVVMIVGLVQSEPRAAVVQYYGYPPQGQPGAYQQPVIQYAPAAPGQQVFCPYCGARLAPGALMCPYCGRGLAQDKK